MSSSYLPYSVLKEIAEKAISMDGGDPNSPESGSVYGRLVEHSKEDGHVAQANFEYILNAVQRAAGKDANDHVDYFCPSFHAPGIVSSISVKVYASEGTVCEGDRCSDEATKTLTIRGDDEHDFCRDCARDFQDEYLRKTEASEMKPIDEVDLHREFTPAFICAAALVDRASHGECFDDNRLTEIVGEHFSQTFDETIYEVQKTYPDGTDEEEDFIAQAIREGDQYQILSDHYSWYSDLPVDMVASVYESYRNAYLTQGQ